MAKVPEEAKVVAKQECSTCRWFTVKGLFGEVDPSGTYGRCRLLYSSKNPTKAASNWCAKWAPEGAPPCVKRGGGWWKCVVCGMTAQGGPEKVQHILPDCTTRQTCFERGEGVWAL